MERDHLGYREIIIDEETTRRARPRVDKRDTHRPLSSCNLSEYRCVRAAEEALMWADCTCDLFELGIGMRCGRLPDAVLQYLPWLTLDMVGYGAQLPAQDRTFNGQNASAESDQSDEKTREQP